MKDHYKYSNHKWYVVIQGVLNLIISHIPCSIASISIVRFYDILFYHNIQELAGNVKPQSEHIDQADGDLGEDEHKPVVAASVMSL